MSEYKDPLIGRHLGKYELYDVLGRGKAATVYKAYEAGLDRFVAIKVLIRNDEYFLARFEREAKTIAALNDHPHILTIYDYQGIQQPFYLVMEYIEQGTLADQLSDKSFNWWQAINIAIPIAEALNYAHQKSFIHRDVKPSNIMIPQLEHPLLADFGIVKAFESDDELSKTGDILGTPEYMPPEQSGFGEIGPYTDIYALGIVLFEIVAGRVPFQHKNVVHLLNAQVTTPAPSPREFNPECPTELERVILQALEKSPEARYHSMQDFIDELKHIQAVYDQPPEFTTYLELQSSIQNTSEYQKTIDLSSIIQEALIIGRTNSKGNPDVDLSPYTLEPYEISRQHARLWKSKDGWLLEDLNSVNGTYVNDTRLAPFERMPLKSTDKVSFSRIAFTFFENQGV